MINYDTIDILEVCKKHTKYLGECRYYNAAEGRAWMDETAQRNAAYKKYDEIESYLEKKHINWQEHYTDDNNHKLIRDYYQSGNIIFTI